MLTTSWSRSRTILCLIFFFSSFSICSLGQEKKKAEEKGGKSTTTTIQFDTPVEFEIELDEHYPPTAILVIDRNWLGRLSKRPKTHELGKRTCAPCDIESKGCAKEILRDFFNRLSPGFSDVNTNLEADFAAIVKEKEKLDSLENSPRGDSKLKEESVNRIKALEKERDKHENELCDLTAESKKFKYFRRRAMVVPYDNIEWNFSNSKATAKVKLGPSLDEECPECLTYLKPNRQYIVVPIYPHDEPRCDPDTSQAIVAKVDSRNGWLTELIKLQMDYCTYQESFTMKYVKPDSSCIPCDCKTDISIREIDRFVTNLDSSYPSWYSNISNGTTSISNLKIVTDSMQWAVSRIHNIRSTRKVLSSWLETAKYLGPEAFSPSNVAFAEKFLAELLRLKNSIESNHESEFAERDSQKNIKKIHNWLKFHYSDDDRTGTGGISHDWDANKLSSYGAYNTRHEARIVVDVGVGAAHRYKSGNIWDPIVYSAFHYNIRALNRDIPLSKYPNMRLFDCKRFSLMAGWTLNSLEIEGQRENFFKKNSVLAGAGYKWTHSFKTNAGLVFVQQVNSNPLKDNTFLKTQLFLSFSVDVRMKTISNALRSLIL